MLHADATSGALTARDASGPGALKPCDHRVSALAEQMVTLQTRWAGVGWCADVGGAPAKLGSPVTLCWGAAACMPTLRAMRLSPSDHLVTPRHALCCLRAVHTPQPPRHPLQALLLNPTVSPSILLYNTTSPPLTPRYALDCPLPGPMPPPYKPARRAVLADVAARLEGAVLATSEGRLLPPGAASLAEAGAAAGLTPAGPWTLALHGPGGVRAGAPGVASLRGVLDARACVGRREGVAAARDALAADVRAGVAARLAPEAPGREGGEATLGTLRRVFLALPEGPLAVAEVLRFGEGEGVALARLQEVLGGAVVAEALALDAPLEVTRYVSGQALRESRNEYAMRNLIIASVLLMIIFVLYMTYFHGR